MFNIFFITAGQQKNRFLSITVSSSVPLLLESQSLSCVPMHLSQFVCQQNDHWPVVFSRLTLKVFAGSWIGVVPREERIS